MSLVLDWTHFGCSDAIVKKVMVKPTMGSSVVDKLAYGISDKLFEVDPHRFNLQDRDTFIRQYESMANDPGWVERMVDRFTLYLDGKFIEFQQWIVAGLTKLGFNLGVFCLEAGQFVCILWIIVLAYRAMIDFRKIEDSFVNHLILSFGGFFVLRCLETAMMA